MGTRSGWSENERDVGGSAKKPEAEKIEILTLDDAERGDRASREDPDVTVRRTHKGEMMESKKGGVDEGLQRDRRLLSECRSLGDLKLLDRELVQGVVRRRPREGWLVDRSPRRPLQSLTVICQKLSLMLKPEVWFSSRSGIFWRERGEGGVRGERTGTAGRGERTILLTMTGYSVVPDVAFPFSLAERSGSREFCVRPAGRRGRCRSTRSEKRASSRTPLPP